MIQKKVAKILILGLTAGSFIFGLFFVNAQGLPQIPKDVREQVPEKDLIEVYCLMTKWKTGEFFAALDALDEVLIPALKELQDLGINVSIPEIDKYRSQGQAKLNEICSAQNYKAVQAAIEDFISFGQGVKQELGGLNGSMAAQLKTKGNEMKAKVESELNVWVEQEKTNIEQELKSKADQSANQAKANLEQEMSTKGFTTGEEAMAYAQSRASQIKATIESQINNLAEQKKKELETKANAKASEILGVDAEKFKAIGEKMQGIEGQINQVIENKKQDYEQYKVQAMAKRKGLILAVLDKNIESAANQIKEKEPLLKEAKLNDSSVKSSDEYITDLNQDKEILVEKIQAAVDEGDETAINSAVDEMKNKWDGIRQGLERDLAKRQSAKQIYSQAMEQISQAKPQVEKGLAQIEAAQKEIAEKKGECDIAEVPLCAEVETVFNQLSIAKEKAENLLERMNLVEQKYSQVTEATPLECHYEVADYGAADYDTAGCGENFAQEDILGLMISLRESGLEFQKEMLALKEKWQVNKAKLEEALAKKPKIGEICSQALPKLASGQSQIEKGLGETKSIQDNCQGSTEKKCELINTNLDKFNLAEQKGKALLDKINSAENKCRAKTDLKELVLFLKGFETELKDFLSLVEELKLLKKAGTEKIYIQAENETSTYLYPRDVSWASNKEIKARWRPGYTGTGDWYLSRGGESLSYNFTVQEGGSYSVWIKDISTYTHSAGARAVNVIVDGKDYGSFSENSVRRGDEPGTWDWHKTATLDLKAGTHILTIKKTETTSAAAILDVYFITNNPLVTP